jgi:hypothetical protein
VLKNLVTWLRNWWNGVVAVPEKVATPHPTVPVPEKQPFAAWKRADSVSTFKADAPKPPAIPAKAAPCVTTCGSSCGTRTTHDNGPDLMTPLLVASVVSSSHSHGSDTLTPPPAVSAPAETLSAPSYSPPPAYSEPAPSYSPPPSYDSAPSYSPPPSSDYGGGGDFGGGSSSSFGGGGDF